MSEDPSDVDIDDVDIDVDIDIDDAEVIAAASRAVAREREIPFDADVPPAIPWWREAWRLLGTFGHAFGAMIDIAMMIMGIGLLSIAVATLLDGFGFVDLSMTDSSLSLFGSALLVGVFGSFALGVANEGPLTSPRPPDTIRLVETNLVRAISIVVVAIVVGWAAGFLPDLLAESGEPFQLGVTVIQQTGRAGIFFGLFIGLPLAVALRFWRSDIREDADFAIIFLSWLLGTIVFVNGTF